MPNDWGISEEDEAKLRRKYKRCVYCPVKMKPHPHSPGTPNDKATFEHIDNNEKNLKPWNICMCCGRCNKSKGSKKLSAWLQSGYFEKYKINKGKVAQIIKDYLKR
jgi:5-methylcytosine-specific restriction endonuclease McrA